MKKRNIPPEEEDAVANERAWSSYYSIGHQRGGILWILNHGVVETVKQGKDQIHDDYWEMSDNTVRGRYDPRAMELSIITYHGRTLPQSMMDKIEATFPDAKTVTHYSVDY